MAEAPLEPALLVALPTPPPAPPAVPIAADVVVDVATAAATEVVTAIPTALATTAVIESAYVSASSTVTGSGPCAQDPPQQDQWRGSERSLDLDPELRQHWRQPEMGQGAVYVPRRAVFFDAVVVSVVCDGSP
eukprot:261622-Rhodomonas_salina.1